MSSVRVKDFSRKLPSPPPVPDGFQSAPPDFVGIGAQRAGTTYWHMLITTHPDIYIPSHFKEQFARSFLPKERHFFDRFFDRRLTDQDREDFRQWFPKPPGMITGEWTPRYAIEHWAPPLLKELAPDAKIIMIVRDPVERFISGMNHRLGDHPTLHNAHVSYLRGLYSLQLETWQRAFDPSRFLILQYEACVRELIPYLERTYEFLGLEAFVPAKKILTRRKNVTKQRRYDLSDAHRSALVDAYASDVARLPSFFPEFDVSLWPNFR